jgi:hypothetical protein
MFVMFTSVVKTQQWEKPPLFAAKKHNQGFQLGLYPDTDQQPAVFVPIDLPWGGHTRWKTRSSRKVTATGGTIRTR